jgi:uncharacterized membrane protein
MCYTDITALFYSRGQGLGAMPYASMQWEYPVLTGYFASVATWISRLFGAHYASDIDGSQIIFNAQTYFAITAVGLFLCLLWLIHSTLKITPNSPNLAMIMAISPVLMLNGLINWDLLVVALTAAGLAAWVEKKPYWAGLWWGLGVAAKLYPIVIIGALFILCLRRDGRYSPLTWIKLTGTAVLVWLATNIPIMLAYPSGWEVFYRMNSGRGADLGSLWYAASLAGMPFSNPAWWSRAVMLVGYLGLAALIFFARRPPRTAQIAYLAVAIMVVANVVYSPQYVLWILPLIVLVRPQLVSLYIFTVSEMTYYIFIWLFLRGNNLSLGISDRPWLYIFSIALRIVATGWVMGEVVRDIWKAPPLPVPPMAEPGVAYSSAVGDEPVVDDDSADGQPTSETDGQPTGEAEDLDPGVKAWLQ